LPIQELAVGFGVFLREGELKRLHRSEGRRCLANVFSADRALPLRILKRGDAENAEDNPDKDLSVLIG
jgi:hypothetical protein